MTTEDENGCVTLPGAEAPEDDTLTGRVAMGSRVSTRGQAEFEYPLIYGGRDKLPNRVS